MSTRTITIMAEASASLQLGSALGRLRDCVKAGDVMGAQKLYLDAFASGTDRKVVAEFEVGKHSVIVSRGVEK